MNKSTPVTSVVHAVMLGTQVVTVNDYLARRDSEWVGQVHRFLGLTVGLVQTSLNQDERRQAYAADVTYVTNSELGFDYLRENLATVRDLLCSISTLNHPNSCTHDRAALGLQACHAQVAMMAFVDSWLGPLPCRSAHTSGMMAGTAGVLPGRLSLGLMHLTYALILPLVDSGHGKVWLSKFCACYIAKPAVEIRNGSWSLPTPLLQRSASLSPASKLLCQTQGSLVLIAGVYTASVSSWCLEAR